MKKLLGLLLLLPTIFFLVVLFPKTVVSICLIAQGLLGHLSGTSYQIGRQMGNATAALIVYVFFFALFGLSLKLAFNLRFWKKAEKMDSVTTT